MTSVKNSKRESLETVELFPTPPLIPRSPSPLDHHHRLSASLRKWEAHRRRCSGLAGKACLRRCWLLPIVVDTLLITPNAQTFSSHVDLPLVKRCSSAMLILRFFKGAVNHLWTPGLRKRALQIQITIISAPNPTIALTINAARLHTIFELSACYRRDFSNILLSW